MKNGAVLAGALALVVSTGASAQSMTPSGLLRQIGGALSGKSGSQAKVSHPLYAEPAGMYWDLDGDTLEGAQHLREGLSSTGAQGIDMCDMGLLAMAHSAYQLRPDKRQWCLRQAWVAAKRTTGSQEAEPSAAVIEQRFGPAFDARLERFKSVRRYAVRPNFKALGGVSYNADRGVMEVFVPMPQISLAGLSVTGKNFVPWIRKTPTGVSSPPNAGRYRLLIRMDPAEAANLARQGRSFQDDRVVFSVNRVWIDGTEPKMDVTVEKVSLGYRNETIEVDVTKNQGEGA